MSLTGQRVPELCSVTVTNTATSLYTLLQTPRPNIQRRAQYLQLQLDLSASGNLYIGNSDVSSTNNGANCVASQVHQQFAFDSNLILLDEIFLLASVASQQVNVMVVTR